VGRGERDVRIQTAAADELSELAVAANAMIDRLRVEEGARDQADAARRDLVAAVSHDLRTPITSLRLLAEAVGDHVDLPAGHLAGVVTPRAHPASVAQAGGPAGP
jgi:signal transduction histidine kinase